MFWLLLVTFVLLGIGAAGGDETVIHWGGYIGLATAAAAAYTALAEVTNDTFDRSVLPLGKLSIALTCMAGAACAAPAIESP